MCELSLKLFGRFDGASSIVFDAEKPSLSFAILWLLRVQVPDEANEYPCSLFMNEYDDSFSLFREPIFIGSVLLTSSSASSWLLLLFASTSMSSFYCCLRLMILPCPGPCHLDFSERDFCQEFDQLNRYWYQFWVFCWWYKKCVRV